MAHPSPGPEIRVESSRTTGDLGSGSGSGSGQPSAGNQAVLDKEMERLRAEEEEFSWDE